jgi:dTDP-4-amino-4,6-dideoxygalactose transaminase
MTRTPAPATDTAKTVAVPPLNLVAQFGALREELLAEVSEVLASGNYILGSKVAAFEAALAEYCGVRHAVGLSSGTDALLVALMALGIGPGDEVVLPAFTFFATAGVVARLGARPVFCDIDPETYNLDVAQAADRISSRTRAIIPVHLYGQLADMPALLDVARRHDIPVIEDAAQAIGARDAAGTRAGAFGLVGCLSFYPTKNLGACGDAGALLTNDDRLHDLVVKLRVHGSGHTYYHDLIGGNFRLDALQAALLTVKLRHLEQWTEQRRARAARYTALLQDAGLVPKHVRLPREVHGRHVYHQYVIRARRRDELHAFLKSRQIGAMIYYPLPLHLQKCFVGLGYRPGDFPHSEQAAAEVLALPMYPELTDEQQQAVVGAMADFYRDLGAA